MNNLPVETGAIMPLIKSRLELDSTVAALNHLWLQRHTIENIAFQLANQDIRQVFLVGSGDSLAVAQLVCCDMESMLAVPCRAYQSYEFISDAHFLLDEHCLVIIISASGRPSPVLDALSVASGSPACVVGITNQPVAQFNRLANYCLFTGAVKRGIPTQSTTAALLLLSLLAAELSYCQNKIEMAYRDAVIDSLLQMINRMQQVQISARDYWLQQDRSLFFNQSITFLATGCCAAIAPLAVNLLSCGPQLHAEFFLLEEYHHSLRLFQVNSSWLFMIFAPACEAAALVTKTALQLKHAGASVITVLPEHYKSLSEPFSLMSLTDINRSANFYHLVFLQELSLQLANDFINQGGIRASLNNG